MNKIVIISAPSGSGKSTLISHLMAQKGHNLEFSISATTREPRGEEQDGKEYYFLKLEDFKEKIAQNQFIEYEEVYQDRFYGTLKSEIDRIFDKGNNVIFDVDVLGGINLKKIFGTNAISVFIQPPSIAELEKRLLSRKTDSLEEIKKRIARAEKELSYANNFDYIIVNDKLEEAQVKFCEIISNFLND